MTPDYLLSGEPGARTAYASAPYKVLGLAFTDDELLLEAGVRLLHDAYPQADYRVIDPAQHGLARIGHFGLFKESGKASLWPMLVHWIEQHRA